MSWGFRLEGDHGSIMLDEQYPIYQVTSESVPLPDPFTGGIVGGFLPGSMTVCVPPVTGQTWLYSVFGAEIGAQERLPSWTDWREGTVPGVSYGWTVVRAQVRPTPSRETHGMRLFDAAGQLIYDSGYPIVYFAAFGGGFTYSHKVMTRNDNKLEAFIFVYRVPIPPVPPGMRVGLLADTLSFYDGWTRRPGNSGEVYYGFPDNSRTHLYLGIQGPPGFSSGSQSPGSIAAFLESIIFVFV